MEPLMDLDGVDFDFDFEFEGLPWNVLRVVERTVKGAVRVVGGYAVLLAAAGATFTALRLADAIARRNATRATRAARGYGKTTGWTPTAGRTAPTVVSRPSTGPATSSVPG